MMTNEMVSPAPVLAPLAPVDPAVPAPAAPVLAAHPPVAAQSTGETQAPSITALAVAVPVMGAANPPMSSEPSPSIESLSAEDDEAALLEQQDTATGAWKKHVWTAAEDARLLECARGRRNARRARALPPGAAAARPPLRMPSLTRAALSLLPRAG